MIYIKILQKQIKISLHIMKLGILLQIHGLKAENTSL